MNKMLTIFVFSLATLAFNPLLYAELSPPESNTPVVSKYKSGQIIAYFDEEGNLVDKSQARYYRIYWGTTVGGYFEIQNFYIGSNKKQSNWISVKSENDFDLWNLTTEMGMSATFYENGEIKSETYSHNGQKQLEAHFKNGKKEGLSTWWHKNGQKRQEKNFKNGQVEGLLTQWYENGQKELEVNIENGQVEGLSTQWYENGKKQYEGNIKNNKAEGFWTIWYENGQKKAKGHRKNAEPIGVWTVWDKDGNKRSLDSKKVDDFLKNN